MKRERKEMKTCISVRMIENKGLKNENEAKKTDNCNGIYLDQLN